MCKRPLVGYPIGWTDETHSKIKYHIVPMSKAEKEHYQNPLLKDHENKNPYGDPIQIPCGKCTECRLNYAKKWSDRCMLELQHHESSYFLTLTYDDEHLPTNDEGYPNLEKSHFQDFMKRLREHHARKFPDAAPLRFYACGEYGSVTRRCHFHAIIFGLYIPDLKFYSKTETGDFLYESPWLDSIWKNGLVRIGSVTPESCAYVARYTSKKADGFTKEYYEELGINPEFTQMSLKPGIGKLSYSPEIFRKGYNSLSTEKGGVRIYPPRYFEKFYEEDCPQEFKAYKEHKIETMENKIKEKMAMTSKSYLDMLEAEESDLKARTKCLVREL